MTPLLIKSISQDLANRLAESYTGLELQAPDQSPGTEVSLQQLRSR